MPVLKVRVNGEWIEVSTGSGGGGSGGSTTVDSSLSTTSRNPVQNRVVTSAINKLNELVGSTSVTDQINAALASLRNLEEVRF